METRTLELTAAVRRRAGSTRLRVIVLMAVSSPWSRRIAVRLSARGVDVQVVDFTSEESSEYLTTSDEVNAMRELEEAVERVHRIRTSHAYLAHVAKAARYLRRTVLAQRIDVVLTLYGGTSALITWLSGVRPYAVYVVGSDVLLANLTRRTASRFTLSAAAQVLANGQHLARETLKTAPGARVRNLYLGIDVERFRGLQTRRRNSRFVCTRVFRPVYDNATVVRAIGEVRDPPEDFAISFLSAGPMLESTITLADQVVPPTLRAKVSFGGWTSDEVLNDVLQSSSFYISASLSDGTSSSLLEIMAAGLIPIVSDIPANREWIVHERSGLLFPPGDHHALARCIERCFRGEPWMPAAVDTNYRLVSDRADIEATIDGLLTLLESMSAAKRAT